MLAREVLAYLAVRKLLMNMLVVLTTCFMKVVRVINTDMTGIIFLLCVFRIANFLCCMMVMMQQACREKCCRKDGQQHESE